MLFTVDLRSSHVLHVCVTSPCHSVALSLCYFGTLPHTDVAGLHWSSCPEGTSGLEVRMDGFNHKLGLLAAQVFRALATPQVCLCVDTVLCLARGVWTLPGHSQHYRCVWGKVVCLPLTMACLVTTAT